MEGLIRWWVNNPVAANLLMFGIVLSGYLGFVAMEREAFPQVDGDQVQVTIPWPGAAPQEVEEQIIKRIEDQLEDVDNIKRVYATAVDRCANARVAGRGPYETAPQSGTGSPGEAIGRPGPAGIRRRPGCRLGCRCAAR